MTFVLGIIAPHSPMLRESIGKEHTLKLKNTLQAYKILEENLYQKHVETLVIFAPHGQIEKGCIAMNMCDTYEAQFKDFGDFSSGAIYQGDIDLMNAIRNMPKENISFQMQSEQSISYAISIPVDHLTARLKNVKIVPIYYDKLSKMQYIQFGRLLADTIQSSQKKIALLASADLSHRLKKEAPGGYDKRAHLFDKKIRRLLEEQKTSDGEQIPEEEAELAGECGFGAILILLGCLQDMRFEVQVLSYEAPFGIGYLAAKLE